MLISNLFSRKVFCIMLIGFAILEVLFTIFFIFVFLFSLNNNSDYIKQLISENNREIQNSFNSFLSRRISSAKQDLFLIGKHSELILGKLNMNLSRKIFDNFKNNFEDSCLINGSNIAQSRINDSYAKIKDKKNPLISYINDYLNTHNDNATNMIEDFQNDTIFNHLSYFIGNNDNITNYISYICLMKSIFKSIVIKESVSKGKYLSLNNIFLFMNNSIFQYLPSETTINNMKDLSIYSDKKYCEYELDYTSSCITDFIKPKLLYSNNSNYTDISYV